MRILMVNKFLYPRAGAETYMLSVAEALKEAGHEVFFFGRAHPGDIPLEQAVRLPNIELGEGNGRIHQLQELFRLSASTIRGEAEEALRSLVRRVKPDLIHAHNVYNQLSPSLFRSIAGETPVVMTVHDYKIVCPNYSLFTKGRVCKRCVGGKYYQAALNRCSQDRLIPSVVAAAAAYMNRLQGSYWRDYRRFLCPSKFMANMLIADGIPAERIHVLPNFAPLVERKSEARNGALLYVGRLSKEKGVDTLIRALAEAGEALPSLRIAGNGPHEESLKKLAKSTGCSSIQWLGRVPPEEVRKEMSQAAAVVVPSLWHENCSISILEAMSEGRAVITTNRGGNSELVRDGVEGAIFEAGNHHQLRSRLQELFIHPEKVEQMGRAAKERCATFYSPATHIKSLLRHYEELLGG